MWSPLTSAGFPSVFFPPFGSHASMLNRFPLDCSPPAPPSMGILQARTLGWATVRSSRGASRPRDQTCISCVSCIGRPEKRTGAQFKRISTCIKTVASGSVKVITAERLGNSRPGRTGVSSRPYRPSRLPELNHKTNKEHDNPDNVQRVPRPLFK